MNVFTTDVPLFASSFSLSFSVIVFMAVRDVIIPNLQFCDTGDFSIHLWRHVSEMNSLTPSTFRSWIVPNPLNGRVVLKLGHWQNTGFCNFYSESFKQIENVLKECQVKKRDGDCRKCAVFKNVFFVFESYKMLLG